MYVRRDLAQQMKPANAGWFGRVNPFAFDIRLLHYADGSRARDPDRAALLQRGAGSCRRDGGAGATRLIAPRDGRRRRRSAANPQSFGQLLFDAVDRADKNESLVNRCFIRETWWSIHFGTKASQG